MIHGYFQPTKTSVYDQCIDDLPVPAPCQKTALQIERTFTLVTSLTFVALGALTA